MITVLIYLPQTATEEIYLTFIMIVNCGVFGYSINEIGNILYDIKKSDKDLKQDINIINRYFERKDVKEDIRYRIRNYLEYIHKEKKEYNQTETLEIVDKLSSNLQEELKKNINNKYIAKSQFLQKNFNPILIDQLFKHCEEINMVKDDIVYTENEYQDLSFYFIIQGKIKLQQKVGKREKPTTQIQILEQYQDFGQIEFITGLPRNYEAICLEQTILLKFERIIFLKILKGIEIKGIQKEYEIFTMLQDKVKNNNFFKLDQKCNTCHKFNHIDKYCPNTHPIYTTQQMKYFLKTTHFNRQRYLRREYNCNSLDINHLVYEDTVNLIMENEMLIENYDILHHYNSKNPDSEYSEGYFTDDLSEEDDKLEISNEKSLTNLNNSSKISKNNTNKKFSETFQQNIGIPNKQISITNFNQNNPNQVNKINNSNNELNNNQKESINQITQQDVEYIQIQSKLDEPQSIKEMLKKAKHNFGFTRTRQLSDIISEDMNSNLRDKSKTTKQSIGQNKDNQQKQQMAESFIEQIKNQQNNKKKSKISLPVNSEIAEGSLIKNNQQQQDRTPKNNLFNAIINIKQSQVLDQAVKKIKNIRKEQDPLMANFKSQPEHMNITNVKDAKLMLLEQNKLKQLCQLQAQQQQQYNIDQKLFEFGEFEYKKEYIYYNPEQNCENAILIYNSQQQNINIEKLTDLQRNNFKKTTIVNRRQGLKI